MKKDIIIIGGGVVGCAVARLLSRYQADMALLEGASDVAAVSYTHLTLPTIRLV